MSEFEKSWVSKDEAAKAIGKSIKTVYRWCKDNPSHVRDNGTINFSELKKTYPIIFSNSDKRLELEIEAGDKMNTQMSLQNSRESINILKGQLETSEKRLELVAESYEKQLQSKDWQIRTLINKRSRLPLWLNVGYTLLIAAILYALWLAFDWFRHEQSNQHEKELLSLKEAARMEIYNLEESADKQAQLHRESIKNFQDKIDNITDIKDAEISALKEELSEIKESIREKEPIAQP